VARKFLTHIDLSKNELQNGVIQNLAAAPSSPVKGQLYYNTADNVLYWWDGTTWIPAKDAGAGPPSVPVTRVINTTAPLTGGGDLSADRTLAITSFAGSAAGAVPTSAGGTANFLRADGTWAAPPSTSFGAVTAEQTFGGTPTDGVATTAARSDHRHANPVHDAAAHSTIPLSALAPPTAAVNFNGQKITNLGFPTAVTDAASKGYVDQAIQGLSWKEPTRVATTANITLSGAATIDGVTLVSGDRVLVKNQTNPAQNGIYDVNTAGAWFRSGDADADTDLIGAAVFVSEGTTYADTAWVMTTNAPITVDTTPLTWVQFGSSTSYVAGGGLTLTGNQFDVGAGTGILVGADTVSVDTATIATVTSVNLKADKSLVLTAGSGLTGGGDLSTARTFNVGAGTGITVAADTVALDTTYTDGRYALVASAAKRFAQDVGGATSQVVTHNLATLDVIVQVYRKASPFDQVECDVEHTSTNTITLRFTVAPAAAEYRVVVLA